jgi:hypothetical protein
MYQTLIALILLLPAQAATAPETNEEWIHQRTTGETVLPDGVSVVVINPFGDVRIRGNSSNVVFSIANIQKRKANTAEASVETRLENGKLFVEVEFPAKEEPEAWKKRPRRVDLTLVIPEGVDLDTTVVNALTEIKGVNGNISARAERGNMTIKTKGTVDLTLRQGNIDLVMASRVWPGDSTINTVHGTTLLQIDERARGEIRIATRGKITTDFTTQIRSKSKSLKKAATMTLAKGGHTIEITSSMGNVEVRKYF